MSIEAMKPLEFTAFEKLWNSICPLQGAKYDLSGFIFRGVSSDKYELLPKVLRNNNNKGELWSWKNKDSIDEYESVQVQREISLLANFYKTANSIGLKIPNTEILKYCDQKDSFDFPFIWLTEEFEETAALAQHYGVPTRLLDWTKDLFTAFYFASKGVIEKIYRKKKISPDDHFAIYALNYFELSDQIMYADICAKDNRFDTKLLPIRFVIPNYSENPNANAQQGLFTYSRRFVEKDNSKRYNAKTRNNIFRSIYASNKVDYTPLNKEIQDFIDLDIEGSLIVADNTVFLYKFILPALEALKMFEFISFFKYSHSKLFPDYVGVKEEMREREIVQAVKMYIKKGNPTHE